MESQWNEKGLEIKNSNYKRARGLFVFDFWNFKLAPIDSELNSALENQSCFIINLGVVLGKAAKLENMA